MKKLVMWFLVFSVSSSGFTQVKGTLEEKDGKKVLTVWGSHQERGYAHGYLMAESVKSVFDNYLVNYLWMSNALIYVYMRNLFVNHFAIEDKYQTEAEAFNLRREDKEGDKGGYLQGERRRPGRQDTENELFHPQINKQVGAERRGRPGIGGKFSRYAPLHPQ